MSIKNLFDKNRQAISVGKFLKKSAPSDIGDGIESAAHLSESLKKIEDYLPPVDYSNPENFVKYGSAKKYYDNAFSHIVNYYPYDGSSFEKVKFYNDLNPLEKYIFENEYPRSTGYIINGSTYGAIATDTTGYFSASSEYIQLKGGPHLGTVYHTGSNRTSNLEFGNVSGSTIEFFFKKDGPIDNTVESERQVIFDSWNGEVAGTAEYGRITIEILSGTTNGVADRFYFTAQSGAAGFFRQAVPSAGGLDLTNNEWGQYSFVLNTSGSTTTLDFYITGACYQKDITSATSIDTVDAGSFIANIGALRTEPSGVAGPDEGYGKLSGSLDEFRFWKSARTEEEIGRYWFTNVEGGADKYDAHVDLGVYYKFNEGLTGTSSLDSIILDYSGRLTNGTYVGYTSASRNTGSAINELSKTSVQEDGDPVVRTQNANYSSSKQSFENLGQQYDYTNTSFMMNTMPSWIYEEDENHNSELQNITQVMGSYLDTLHLQVEELSQLRHNRYLTATNTGSLNEFPHNDRLLESLGLEVPEIFENAGVLEKFFQRDEQINFDQEIDSIKNSIYRNIYNNISYIFKSKGNEKSIRNLIRCYGIGEEILALNIYANNQAYTLESEYRAGVSPKKYADFTGLYDPETSNASIYQYYDSSNTNSYGILTGSTALQENALTVEYEAVFTNRDSSRYLQYTPPNMLSSSLFGWHTPAVSSVTSTNTTWASAPVDLGLQVYAVRDYSEFSNPDIVKTEIPDAKFVVKDRHGNTLLTSSVFADVYNNQKWNFALTVHNEKYPFAQDVVGASLDANSEFILQLYGVNYDSGIKRSSFTESTTLNFVTGSSMLTSDKRFYMGAHRTNFTGNVEEQSDVKGAGLRVWNNLIPTGTIDHHARDADQYGPLRPYRQAYTFEGPNLPRTFVPNIQTLALFWDLSTISSSNVSGQFSVPDFSSGSIAADYESQYQGTTFSELNLRQHTGRGDFFPASYAKSAIKEYVYTEKTQLPEYVQSSDMIEVSSTDVEVFKPNIKPTNLFFSVEKSMYRSISNRMLALFASIEDMNNLIGEPVNRYRPNYKDMEKLTEIFFRKVGEVPDFQKYVEFYKWIDVSMGQIVSQMFPASSRHSTGTRTIIENHLLERPKIQWRYLGNRKRNLPSIINKPRDGRIPPSLCHNAPGWKFTHAPLSENLNENCNWWQTRALRTNPSFGSSVSNDGIVETRNASLKALQFNVSTGIINYPEDISDKANIEEEQRGLQVVCLSADLNLPKIGGINQHINKRRNIRNITFDRFESLEDCTDVLNPVAKTKIPFRAQKDGDFYKGEQITPFSVFSSSVSTGYAAGLGLGAAILTNMHEDSVAPYDHSVPMQGPFTNQHVGGFIARHVSPFTTDEKLRPEKHTLSISSATGTISQIEIGDIPKGQYLRGLGSKSPLNITNIRTTTGSLDAVGSVNVLGNFTKNYEIVQTNDRSKTNIDFVFNNDQYYTGSIDSPFISSISRRATTPFAETGSVEFSAPRQRSGRRTTESIFVNRFSAPGSKEDSKQQFRDIASDQLSPNNALPYRNVYVRRFGTLGTRFTTAGSTDQLPLGASAGLNGFLRLHTGWGGFQETAQFDLEYLNGAGAIASPLSFLNAGNPMPAPASPLPFGGANITNGSPGLAALHKTQRNTTFKPVSVQTTAGVYDINPTRDNAFIVRPIPMADRSSWFMAMSGANDTTYTLWEASGSKYPDNLTLTESVVSTTTFPDSVFSDFSSNGRYLWEDSRGFPVWKQTRVADGPQGRYFTKNNTYEIPLPVKTFVDQDGALSGKEYAEGSGTRDFTDRAGNVITYKYKNSFREPPISSKYFPIETQIKTRPGTPARTNMQKQIDVTVGFSYGNDLQGFANKQLNLDTIRQQLFQRIKFKSGLQKTPYEIFRDNYNEGVSKYSTGVDLIKRTDYKETIFPREIHTYLSASRQRLAFENSFWRSDVEVSPIAEISSFTGYSDLRDESNIKKYNLDYNRLVAPFTTSQGYVVQASEQVPYDPTDSTIPIASGFGSASMWSMDSFLYGTGSSILASVKSPSGVGSVLFAAASTMACGELMMTSYGTVSGDGDPSGENARFVTSSCVSAQYIYSFPSELDYTGFGGGIFAEASSPGGAYTRPPWESPTTRRNIDTFELSDPKYPFYASYNDYVSDLRAIGQEYSILPEFRISENLDKYRLNGDVLAIVSSSLELTGAGTSLDDSSDTGFIARYATSDVLQYLDPFMQHGTSDIDFNKPPRHFEIESKALIKLLPYDGFYPMDRSLQIASLFSESYATASAVSWSGTDSAEDSRWRTALRPFFAPGIFFNSIKSGVGVSYPVSRADVNLGQFAPVDYSQPLAGGLSGTTNPATIAGGLIPGGRRRRTSDNYDFSSTDVDSFFWADSLPFEAIFSPMAYLSNNKGLTSNDLSSLMNYDITASFSTPDQVDDLKYKLAVSNFLASATAFFLKEKEDGGHMTKFVAEMPSSNPKGSPQGVQPPTETDRRTTYVDAGTSYLMEIGLKKTDNFNLYSNPYAFGPPTATGSLDWDQAMSITGYSVAKADGSTLGGIPEGFDWPLHRGEFAPFTPAYYYGDSVVRLSYTPSTSGFVSLSEIFDNIVVEYSNKNDVYYDFSSGSYTDITGNAVSTTDFPIYQWNRAWQNRQDIDSSIIIDNRFPTEGGTISPLDPNKWVIMPKWECPILDNRQFASAGGETWDFSSSVEVGSYNSKTHGMWHQYGLTPRPGEGVYLYISDVVKPDGTKVYERKLLGDPDGSAGSGPGAGVSVLVSTVPKAAASSDTFSSLAKLVGFKDEEIMAAGTWDPSRAKRLGELEEDGKRTMSEAVIAMPFYEDAKTNKLIAMTMTADKDALGPKIKEFRRVFTKYSLPPALRASLAALLPNSYPEIPNFIDPFGVDERDQLNSTLGGLELLNVPIVYLMEHTVKLSKQDLADIWQGIMPDIGTTVTKSLAAIDHYMPGEEEEDTTVFPEILKAELDLGLPRSGHPRVDLIDTRRFPELNGFQPKIKWLVFKVKERGPLGYSDMIFEEINDGPKSNSFEYRFGNILNTLSPAQRQAVENLKDAWALSRYHSSKVGKLRNTYNWPYDYCSIIETAKINTKVGFRPELAKEVFDPSRTLDVNVDGGLQAQNSDINRVPGRQVQDRLLNLRNLDD